MEWQRITRTLKRSGSDHGCKIVSDGDSEPWTRSECTCEICSSMNNAHDTWDDFIPQTNLEKKLKKAIDSRK